MQTTTPLPAFAAPGPETRTDCSPVTSMAVAAAVVACVVSSGEIERLPALGWVAAFLFLVVEHDVRTLRIPNWLTFPALALALAAAAVQGGFAGFGVAFGGTALAFLILFPAFAFGWLGAGDVKAAMVLGALCGAAAMPGLVWWMFVAGGALAIALVAAQGGLPDLLRRWGHTLSTFVLTRRWSYVGPAADSTVSTGLPFAVAMGLAVSALQLWGVPWS